MPTVTLRPAGAGDATNLTANGAANNYECVNESSSDGDTTYVSLDSTGINGDLYTIDSNPIGDSDTINSVTVYAIARCTTTGRLVTHTVSRTIKENGVTTQSTASVLTTTYALYSTTWSTKPSNGAAFTKTDITNLQIGGVLVVDGTTARITTLYVVVDYTVNSASSKLGLLGVG